MMSRNGETDIESNDDDDEEEYSQDFEDDLNDSGLLSVASSSSQDILSPPPIQRISDNFDRIGILEEEEGGNHPFEIPHTEEHTKESEAKQFKREFEVFRSKAEEIENSNSHESNGKGQIIKIEDHKDDIAVEDLTLRKDTIKNERGLDHTNIPNKINFIVHHDEQMNKNGKKPQPLRRRIGYSKSRIEYLSRPRRKQLPESMSIPSRVSTKSSWNDFIERQEYMESQRRMKQDHRRKERDYQDKVDKLRCPVCSTEQTFKEYIDSKTSCQCGAQYKKVTFHLRKFEARMFKSRIRKQKQIQSVLDERKAIIAKGNRTINQKIKDATKVRGEDFINRMKQDQLKRTKKDKEKSRRERN